LLDDLEEVRAQAFREGARAASDAIYSWEGSLKADPDRRIQKLFASIAAAVSNPHDPPSCVGE